MVSKDGQTPLSPDEKVGLKPDHISTRQELDELEAENIQQALSWLPRRKNKNPLSVNFMKTIHKRMLCDVWEWAGQFSRQHQRLIGSDANMIEQDLRNFIDYVEYWSSHQTYNDEYELLARFHHRLTRIHPFPNGNGRWARLMTDIFAEYNKLPKINWGGIKSKDILHKVGKMDRKSYIKALRAADTHDFTELTNLFRHWGNS